MVISYDGTKYHGWQIQKNAITVQKIFQNALYKILNELPDIKGCSRTDTGVHANNYYINFKTYCDIPCNNLIYAMNSLLPNDIVVKQCDDVNMNFHARYSCIAKEYVYKIWNNKIRNPFMNGYALHYWYPLDIDMLNDISQAFLGEHNFTSFCTIDSSKHNSNMIRKILKFDINKYNDLVEIKVIADGFLYNMMRIIVGTLIKNKKLSRELINKIIYSKNRKNAGPTAPAHGLYLNKVFYKDLHL